MPVGALLYMTNICMSVYVIGVSEGNESTGASVITARRADVPPARPVSALFYQVLFSLPLLIGVALVVERGSQISLSGEVVAAFAFQTIVPTASYLVWFAMIRRFRVSQLSAFTLLAPAFGVLVATLMLGEPVGWPLLLGLALITFGIYVVIAPRPPVRQRAE
jgi:drug/metabolite transporter (DMT)-like permease